MGPSTSTSASKSDLFVAVLSGALVFIMAARTPLDSDLFWHLKTGEDMLTLGHPVLSDLLSFTRAGAVWVNHSWLSQILLALLFRMGNYFALGAWMALSATASMLLVYRRMSAPPLWRAFVIVLASLVAAPVWSARPQLFSLLMLASLANFLDAWQAGRVKGWWLLPIFILWSNLHGGYPLGLILIACWVGGELLNHLSGREGSLALRRVLALAGWGLLAWLVVAVNPNGMAMWAIPFQTVGVGALQQAIPEWASPDFHDLTQQPFMWMLAGLLAAIGLSGKRVDGKALVSVIVFCAMGLVARRNFGPFALLAAPVLAEHTWTVLARILQRVPKMGAAGRPLPMRAAQSLNLLIAGLLMFVAVVKLYVVTQPVLVDHYLRESYPVGAADWLRSNGVSGHLFSAYEWGGYLEWALPTHAVFLDGRTDLFGDAIIREWSNTVAGQAGWRETLERYQVTYVLLAPGLPLLHELEQAGWRVAYQDEKAVLYAK
jgi:hypothetical protein